MHPISIANQSPKSFSATKTLRPTKILTNNLSNNIVPAALVDIPFSPGLELFQLAVKEGHLLPNGEAAEKLATAPFLTLTRSSLERMQEALDHFGITAALLNIVPVLEKLKGRNYDQNKCIKIVGSAIFWILGREYMKTLLEDANIDLDALPKEFLDRIFKKPADLDIRLDLRGMSNAVLEQIGKQMTAFMRKSKTCPIIFEKEPFLFVDENTCYNLIGIKRKKEDIFSADVVIASHLKRESLSAMTGGYLCLSLKDLELIRDKKFSNLTLCPYGEYSSATYNLFIFLFGRFVAADYENINISGAKKYTMAIADGKMAMHKELHDHLWGDVYANLLSKPDGMDKLLKLIKNHQPSSLTYPVAVLFNIRSIYLDHFKRISGKNPNCFQRGVFEPSGWAEFNKLLFPTTLNAQSSALKKPIQVLYNLMKANEVPHEVISAFFLLHSNLLMARRHGTDKKSISAYTDKLADKLVTLLTLYEEDSTLLLDADIPSALNTLINYFKNSADQSKIKLLKPLEELFFKGIETKFPFINYADAPNAEMQGRLMIASAAGELLKHKELKAMGFMLLCQASQRMGLKSNLPFLSSNLLTILLETEFPQQRVAILHHYLHYLERCHPQDGLFQMRENIDDLLALFSLPTTSPFSTNEKLTQAYCKAFAHSHHPFLASSILEEVKKEDRKTFLKTAREMIERYLNVIRPPAASLALNILSVIAKNQQVSYNDLSTYFKKIYSNYDPSRLLLDLNRLHQTAMELLERKEINDSDLDNQVYIALIDLLISKAQFKSGASLIDKAEKKNLFAKCPEPLAYFYFRCSLNEMHNKEWGEALRYWQKANYQFVNCQDEELLNYYLSIDQNQFQMRLISPESGELKARSNADALMQPLLYFPLQDLSKETYEQWGSHLFSGPIGKLSAPYAQKCLLCLAHFYAAKIDLCDPKLFVSKGSWFLQQIGLYCVDHQQLFDQLKTYFKKASNLDSQMKEILLPRIGAICFKAFVNLLQSKKMSVPEQEISSVIQEMLASTDQSESMSGFLMLCNSEHFIDSLFKQLFKELPKMLLHEDLCQRDQIFEAFCLYISKSPKEVIPVASLEEVRQIFKSKANQHLVLKSFCEFFAAGDPTLCFEVVYSTCKMVQDPLLPFTLIGHYAKSSSKNALKMLVDQSNKDNTPLSALLENWNSLLENADNSHLDDHINIALRLIPKTQIDKSKLSEDLWRLIGICCDFNEFSKAISIHEAGKRKKLFDVIPISDCLLPPLRNAEDHTSCCERQQTTCQHALKLCQHYYALNKSAEAHALSLKLLPSANFLEFLLKRHGEHCDDKLIELMLKGLANPSTPKLELDLALTIFNDLSEKQNKNALSSELKQLLSQNHSKMAKILKPNAQFCSFLKLICDLKFDLHIIIDELDLWPLLQNMPKEYVTLFPTIISTPDKLLKDGQTTKSDTYYALAQNYANELATLLTCLERAIITSKNDVLPSIERYLLFDNAITELEKMGALQKSKELIDSIEKKWPSVDKAWLARRWENLALTSISKLPILAALIFLSKGPFVNLNDHAVKLGQNLLALNNPLVHPQILDIAKHYDISNALFWKDVLSLYSAKPKTGNRLLERLCSQDRPFIGSESDCQACWLKLLELIKENKKPLILPLLRKYDSIVEPFDQYPSLFSANLAYSFLHGLIDLLIDPTVSHVEKQEILSKTTALYDSCVNLVPDQNIIQITIRFTDFKLSTITAEGFPLIVNTLDEIESKLTPLNYKRFEVLLGNTIDKMIELNITNEEDVGVLEVIVDSVPDLLDPFTILRFYTHQLNEERYQKIQQILFPKENEESVKFEASKIKKLQKKLPALMQKILLWLRETNPLEFRAFLVLLENKKTLTAELIAHWHAIDICEILEISLKPNTLTYLRVLNLANYYTRAPKLFKGGEQAIKCDIEAAKLLLKLQITPNLPDQLASSIGSNPFKASSDAELIVLRESIVQSDEPPTPDLQTCLNQGLCFLRDLLQALVKAEGAEFEELWYDCLEVVSLEWKSFLDSKEQNWITSKSDEIFSTLFSEINKGKNLIDQPKNFQLRQKKVAVYNKAQAKRISTILISNKKIGGINNNTTGKHIQAFLVASLHHMAHYQATDKLQQCSILTYTFFYADLLATLFVPHPSLGEILMTILTGSIYPDNMLCSFQFDIVKNIFYQKCFKNLSFLQNNPALLCKLTLWYNDSSILPEKYKSNVELLFKVISETLTDLCKQYSGPKIIKTIQFLQLAQRNLRQHKNSDLLHKLYLQVYKAVINNPAWESNIVGLEKRGVCNSWTYFGAGIPCILENLTVIQESNAAIFSPDLSFSPIVNELLRYYLKLFLQIFNTDQNPLKFEYLYPFLEAFVFTEESFELNLTLIVSIMPIAAKEKENHSTYLTFITQIFRKFPSKIQLFFPYLNRWISCLNENLHPDASQKVRDSDLYREMALKKPEVNENGSLYSPASIEKLKAFYFRYFDLVIDSYSPNVQQSYLVLMDEFKDFYHQPCFRDPVVEWEMESTEILLRQKLMPLAIKQPRKERDRFYKIVELTLIKNIANVKSKPLLIPCIRTWTQLLYEAKLEDELKEVISSDYLPKLFLNTELMTTYFDNFFLEMTASTINFLESIPEINLLQVIASKVLDLPIEISLSPIKLTPRWKCLGLHLYSAASATNVNKQLALFYKIIINLSLTDEIGPNAPSKQHGIHFMPTTSFEGLKLIENRNEKDAQIVEKRLCQEEPSAFYFLMDLLEKLQILSPLRGSVGFILSLYELLMPLAIKQNNEGRQMLYRSLVIYQNGHQREKIELENKLVIHTEDCILISFYDWLHRLAVDYPEEWIKIVNSRFFSGQFYLSPLAIKRCFRNIMKRLNDNPNLQIPCKMTPFEIDLLEFFPFYANTNEKLDSPRVPALYWLKTNIAEILKLAHSYHITEAFNTLFKEFPELGEPQR